MGITFDGSITLGAVLNALVLLIGFVVAFTRVGGRIDLLTQRLQGVERALNQTHDFNVRLALSEDRLSQLKQEFDALRRGEGWISVKRVSVDGEYK